MRAEKLNLTKEYVARLNASPFFIVVSFQGLNVGQLTELRKRLFKVGAEFHVVKPGAYVVCAVTGVRIPLKALRYWNVDRQEPYADAAAAMKGFGVKGAAQ